MANTNKQTLTVREITFMRYWKENIIPSKNRISSGMLDRASNYLGYKRSGNCSTCMKNDAIELNNKYRNLLPSYEQYLKDINTTTTTTTLEEIPMEQVLPEEETTSTTTTTKKKRYVRKTSTSKKKK